VRVVQETSDLSEVQVISCDSSPSEKRFSFVMKYKIQFRNEVQNSDQRILIMTLLLPVHMVLKFSK
jgi:hypothetical protein